MHVKLIVYFVLCNYVKSELVNVFVQRNVDIRTHLAKTTAKIIVKNLKDDETRTYKYLIDPTALNYHVGFTNEKGEFLHHETRDVTLNDVTYKAEEIYIRHPFRHLKSYEINVEETLIGKVQLAQKKKRFETMDFVSYIGDFYYLSMYDTLKCNTTFLANNKFDPQSLSLKDDEYHFVDIKALDRNPFRVDFYIKSSMFHVLDLKRVIDISQFGFVTITENIHLKNTGAEVYGPFKRMEEKDYNTHLPSSATDLEMFDEIGLIYSRQLVEEYDYITLKFRPRFQLHGGWQTKYTIRYTVPLYQYSRAYGDNTFEVRMRCFDHVLPDAVIDKFTTKVLLPESSSVGHNFVPPEFKRMPNEKFYTHLSTFGRTAIVFGGRNVVEDHITDFTVKYSLHFKYLLRAPLQLSSICYGVFVMIIFGRRLFSFFSIHPTGKAHKY